MMLPLKEILRWTEPTPSTNLNQSYTMAAEEEACVPPFWSFGIEG